MDAKVLPWVRVIHTMIPVKDYLCGDGIAFTGTSNSYGDGDDYGNGDGDSRDYGLSHQQGMGHGDGHWTGNGHGGGRSNVAQDGNGRVHHS